MIGLRYTVPRISYKNAQSWRHGYDGEFGAISDLQRNWKPKPLTLEIPLKSLDLISSWCPCKGWAIICPHYKLALSLQPLVCAEWLHLSLLGQQSWAVSSWLLEAVPGWIFFLGWALGVQVWFESSHTQCRIPHPEDRKSEAWSSSNVTGASFHWFTLTPCAMWLLTWFKIFPIL
jgi:hypothetical protein